MTDVEPENGAGRRRDVTGYVLAGGRSTRMGRDKSALRLGESTLLEIAVAKLGRICAEVRISGDRSSAALRSVADLHDNRGAPGGVASILADCETEFALVVAVDLPFAGVEIMTRIVDAFDAGTDAVVPRQSDGELQPLAAAYRVAACREAFAAALADRRETPSMKRILSSLNVKIIDAAPLGADESTFLNINTPDDFELARRLARS